MVQTAARVLRESFGGDKTPTRLEVARALKHALIDACRAQRDCPLKDESGQPITRSDDEDYALTMLIAGMRLTPDDEWAWSWLGYILTDAPEESSTAR